MVYYSEFDAGAAEWLRELIRADLTPQGEVDERDIREVQPSDLKGFSSCHFFAGIGGWPHALRLAGWPDTLPVWTGSCPCQPYSSAGKGKGDADERNLWPEFFRLIRECRPDVVFGEQVEAAIRHGWLDGISADLEGEGYAVGSAVLGAHSVGAPHIRQRLYWVADRGRDMQREQWWCFRCGKKYDKPAFEDAFDDRGNPTGVYYCPDCRPGGKLADAISGDLRGGRHDLGGTESGVQGEAWEQRVWSDSADGGEPSQLANPRQQPSRDALAGSRLGAGPIAPERRAETVGEPGRRGELGGMGDTNGIGEDSVGGVPGGSTVVGAGSVGSLGDTSGKGLQERIGDSGIQRGAGRAPEGQAAELRSNDGFWSDFALIPCRDGKARRTQPGLFPLADGLPGRVGLLRGAGNAICPQTAAAFVEAWIETQGSLTP